MKQEEISFWTEQCLKQITNDSSFVWNSRKSTCKFIIEWTINAMRDKYKLVDYEN